MTNKIWFLPKKSNTKRILFHAINHVGLGHLNRSIAVAQWLKARIPDLQVLFLIEGGEDFIDPTGFPWILVPGQATESEHCEQITRSVLKIFRPALVIHDTLIRKPIHQAAKDEAVRQVLVGRVGEVFRDEFRHNLQLINEMDLLLIGHQRDEVSPPDQALFARYNGKIVYTGPIVRQKDRVSSDNLRRKLGLTSSHKAILLTFGGGGWDTARDLLANLLAAKTQILDRYPEAKLIVISGPHFSGELPETDEFVCYISKFEPFFTDYLNIASVVVSMAGYNTVNEVVASGLPAICVPASEADDQLGRVEVYAQHFPQVVLGSVDVQVLAQQLIDALAQKRNLSVMQEFWRRAEMASQSVVDEIKCLLDGTI